MSVFANLEEALAEARRTGKTQHFGDVDVLDDTPVEVPVRLSRPLTLQEQIERCFRAKMQLAAEAREAETFAEADDLDIPEDDELMSAYEMREEEPYYPPIVEPAAEKIGTVENRETTKVAPADGSAGAADGGESQPKGGS